MKKYVICFLDLLGATKAIENDDKVVLKLVNRIYKIAESVFTKKLVDKNTLEIKAFSDNIVLAKIINEEEDEHSQILEFIICISVMLNGAFKKNLLFRGGITIGDFFVDETMVWGKALVKAYSLESKIAIYPRVIIDDCVIKRLFELNEYSLKFFRVGQICLDNDGRYFVDYLDKTDSKRIEKIVERNNSIEAEFEYIVKYFAENKVSESVRGKFLWGLSKRLCKPLN